MSGGSMNYLSYKVEDAEFAENTPERRAFRKHLQLVAKALHEIEWCDSGDNRPGKDTEAILRCIERADVLDTLIEQAKEIKSDIEKYIGE